MSKYNEQPLWVIFDLDGVLVNTKDIHFEALNEGLRKISNINISYSDHLNYDGLPSLTKLKILNKEGKLKKTMSKF